MLSAIIAITMSFGVAAEFSYEDLVSIAQSKKSIEEILPLLPEAFRSNYTLMHTSRSLQVASSENPRAILFGERAKLICSFNGESSQRGYDSLECIQFREKERVFEFRQIQFPTSENGLEKVAFSESGKSVDGKISCSRCHRTEARPNWDEYQTWRGAYGEIDDHLVSTELQNYETFVKLRDQHPRYRWLIQERYKSAPYIGPTSRITERPNLRLSDYTGKWNALRINRILKSRLPEWRLLGLTIGMLNYSDFSKCFLNAEQDAVLKKDAVDFEKISQLRNVLKELDLTPEELGTFIQTPLKAPPEHQSGFGFMSLNTAMSVIEDLAAEGNKTFGTIIEEIKSDQSGDSDLSIYAKNMSTIVSHISPYDDGQTGQNLNRYVKMICPELTRVFISKYRERGKLNNTAGAKAH